MIPVRALVLSIFAAGGLFAETLPAFRPPCVPLVSIDPSFSAWSAADRLYERETECWDGAKRPISIRLTADGVTYRLCGAVPFDLPVLPQRTLEVRANESLYTFGRGALNVQVSFLTPRLPDDPVLFAQPVTYVTIEVTGAKTWTVDLSAKELVASTDGTSRIVGPLRGNGFVRYLLAYDDKVGIRYFGQVLKPCWTKGGVTFDAMLENAAKSADETIRRTRDFDSRLETDARAVGGERYARIVALAWRQSFAACKYVIGPEGDPFLFSRECGSGEMIGTTDVFYPQLPHLIYAGSAYVRATLAPTMAYAASAAWPYDYAPHDLGIFPNAEGQHYGMKKGQSVGGGADDSSRMPVEECGNMLICLGALSEQEGNAAFASRWWPIVTKWARYLEKTGFDPANQLCTDDFAGHLAHNANLSVKSILAIAAYGRMCELRGEEDEARRCRTKAESWTLKWLASAKGGAKGAYRLAFDQPGTWSLKYNLVWDRLLGFGLFPKDVAETEMKAYRELLDDYGLAIDNRKPFAKADWIVWAASLTDRADDLHALIAPLYRFLDETPDRVPFSDWYLSDSGLFRSFRGRSVVGGVMLPLLKPLRGAATGSRIAASEMKAIYDEIKTPFKHGVILAPEKGHMLDNPNVFRHAGRWYMLYIDFDGKGYETHLAVSDNLLDWEPLGCTFPRGGSGAWDSAQSDGWPILLDSDWNGANELKRHDGRYWMMYIGGAKTGYETDPLSEGVAWTDDPTRLMGWTRYPRNPVLSPDDPDARSFEKKTIYKSFVVEDNARLHGGRFVAYYNAKQCGKWVERIGMAVSDDLLNWRRLGSEPCIQNEGALDNGICGDPMVRRIGDTYVMFFFGYNWEGKPNAKGFDTFAASKDLVHWTRWCGPNLVEPSEDWDAQHAHKPWVIKHDGVVYHFYCAVGSRGRALALATSKPVGKSR